MLAAGLAVPAERQCRLPAVDALDQHSVAFGTVGGKAYVYVGNDGGIYRRPANGTVNRNGNGTDWRDR